MNLGPDGEKLIKEFEDCKLIAYPDPKTGGDPWTIGWGHTGPDVYPGLVWTQEQADEAFMQDAQQFVDLVNAHVKVELTQEQFDAMVSILFNVGPGGPRKDGIIRLKDGRPSTLLRRLNEGDYNGAALAFMSWVSPGSSVERGLRRRRRVEMTLFTGGDWEEQLTNYA